MNLCQYKHIFGEPNTGIRIYRLFGISIFDVVVVLFAGIIISYLFKMNIWMLEPVKRIYQKSEQN
jgi:hypothetical protein